MADTSILNTKEAEITYEAVKNEIRKLNVGLPEFKKMLYDGSLGFSPELTRKVLQILNEDQAAGRGHSFPQNMSEFLARPSGVQTVGKTIKEMNPVEYAQWREGKGPYVFNQENVDRLNREKAARVAKLADYNIKANLTLNLDELISEIEKEEKDGQQKPSQSPTGLGDTATNTTQ